MKKIKVSLKEFIKLTDDEFFIKIYKGKKWDKLYYYNNNNEINSCLLSKFIDENNIYMSVIKNTDNFNREMLYDVKLLIDFYISINIAVSFQLSRDYEKVIKIIKKRYENVFELENNVVLIK